MPGRDVPNDAEKKLLREWKADEGSSLKWTGTHSIQKKLAGRGLSPTGMRAAYTYYKSLGAPAATPAAAPSRPPARPTAAPAAAARAAPSRPSRPGRPVAPAAATRAASAPPSSRTTGSAKKAPSAAPAAPPAAKERRSRGAKRIVDEAFRGSNPPHISKQMKQHLDRVKCVARAKVTATLTEAGAVTTEIVEKARAVATMFRKVYDAIFTLARVYYAHATETKDCHGHVCTKFQDMHREDIGVEPCECCKSWKARGSDGADDCEYANVAIGSDKTGHTLRCAAHVWSYVDTLLHLVFTCNRCNQTKNTPKIMHFKVEQENNKYGPTLPLHGTPISRASDIEGRARPNGKPAYRLFDDLHEELCKKREEMLQKLLA